MNDLRRVPVHRSVTRQHLLAGCDRELFFLLVMFCGLLLMSGFTRMYWRNILLAVVLWIVGIAVLSRLATYDEHFRAIIVRSVRYLRTWIPANGLPGVDVAVHKRWD